MDPHRWGQSMVGDPRQPAGMRPARSCTASVDDAHQLVAHRSRFRSASSAARRQARASCLVSLDDYPRPRPLRHGVLHAASPGRAKGQPKYNRCVSRYPQAPPALPGRVDASQGRRVARRRPQPRSHPRLPGGPRNHATQYHSHAQRPARRHPQLLPLRARHRARPRAALSTRARHPREEGATSRARLPQRHRAGALLAQIDRSTQVGERDYLLVAPSRRIWHRAMSDSSHLRLSGSTAKADANGSRPCCRKPLGWCDASSPRQDAAKTRRRR